MKGHEHKYISGMIGDMCDFCGLLRMTIEACYPDPVEERKAHQEADAWSESLKPLIEKLLTPASSFSQERINSEMQDKINELVEAINKLNRP